VWELSVCVPGGVGTGEHQCGVWEGEEGGGSCVWHVWCVWQMCVCGVWCGVQMLLGCGGRQRAFLRACPQWVVAVAVRAVCAYARGGTKSRVATRVL